MAEDEHGKEDQKDHGQEMSRKDIANYLGVAVETVSRALHRLQDEGLVSRERGRGTFVTAPAIERSWGVGVAYSLFRSVESLGYEQRSRVLDLSEVTDGTVTEHYEVVLSLIHI